MAGVPSKHDLDQARDFQEFLNHLQDWELSLGEKDKKMKPRAPEKEVSVSSSQKAGIVGQDRRPAGKIPRVDYSNNKAGQYDAIRRISGSLMNEESTPDAASEKELGNDYFKQKKFKEAIDCYSRSIALSPSAVAYANRAMAYIKIRRFQDAENDCTEALNLDDRYIKAYSRRTTARKELGKLKESIEDSEFALRLEPHNQEIKKQHTDAKSLYEKEVLQRASGVLRKSVQGVEKAGKSKTIVNGHVQEASPATDGSQKVGVTAIRNHTMENDGQVSAKTLLSVEEIESKGTRSGNKTEGQEVNGSRDDAIRISGLKNENDGQVPAKTLLSVEEIESKGTRSGNKTKGEEVNGSRDDAIRISGLKNRDHKTGKPEVRVSVQELASRAASRAMVEAAKNITPPNSAYQFEASWRGLSGDVVLQARLLKAISPNMLPQIFKNALSAPILTDIVKCVASFFTEEMDLAIKYLEHLSNVPRFDMIIMCLSAADRADILKIWDGVFGNNAVPTEYVEVLDRLHMKYCPKR